MGYIYKIKNTVNSKLYIGQTKYPLIKRFNEHLYNAKKGKNSPLYNAIRQYGKEKFFISLLEEVDEKDSLDEAEEKWIKKFNTITPNGYNILPGGTKFVKDSNPMYIKEIREKVSLKFSGDNNPSKRPEVKEKIRKSALGKKATPETRKKMSENNGRYWKGRKIPQYIIDAHAKKSRTLLGELNKTSKKVWMLNLNNEKIKLFNGCCEAKRFLEKEKQRKICDSNISRCASGKQKTAYGYKWKYVQCID